MRTFNQTIKRTTLALVAVTIAFAWTQTGRAQVAPCLVGRGQDPLELASSTVRHNVWIILDSSGSMNEPFPGSTDPCDPSLGVFTGCRIGVAKDVITSLMDRVVDAAGRPLVNWAFVHYDEARNVPIPGQFGEGRCGLPDPPDAPDDLDLYPDIPFGCFGLDDSSFIPPPLCGDDSRDDIKAVLDGLEADSGTPLGVTFTDIAEYLIGQHRPDDPTVTPNRTDFVDNLLPGQRNYIIQVTDGVDTCECFSGGYTGGGTLDPSVEMRPDQVDPAVIQLSGVCSNPNSPTAPCLDIASYNAGLKGEIAIQHIDPALDGSKGNIFVVGLDVGGAGSDNARRLNTVAWMASGARLSGRPMSEMNPAFFADDREGLVNSFEDILARVGVPETEVSLGASVVASVKEVIATRTNPGVASLDVIPLPGSSGDAFRQARQIRADHRNNVVFSTTVELPSFRGHLRANATYRVTDANFPRTAREADLGELWDAGVELQDDNPDLRPLFFSRRGLPPSVLPFDTANVLPADLGVVAGYLSEIDGTGALSDDDARDIVVKVTRGYRLSVHPGTGKIYDPNGDLNFSLLEESGERTWKLGENIAGTVAVVSNPPRSPDFDPPLAHAGEYGVGGSVPGDGFYWDHINRRTLVFYPSNRGILHAFDAETGAEVIGYLPDDVVGLDPNEVVGSRDTLKDIVRDIVAGNNGIASHKFSLAGPPTVDDVFLRSDRGQDDNWHTLVVFGRGRGGRFLTALDVTNVASDPTSLRLLWNRGNREGIVEGPIDGLGETWSTPVLGNVDTRIDPSTGDNLVDQALVFAGGGYGCDSGVNDANEGQYLYAFRAEDGFIHYRGWVGNDVNAAIPYNALPARPTPFVPHEQDVADSKDFVTRIFIPDVQGNVHKLDTTQVDPANWTLRVFAAMGPDHPITAPVTVLNDVFAPDRVYVMVGSGGDRRVEVPPLGFKFRIWVDNDLDGVNTTQYAATDTPVFEEFFNIGERMNEQAVTSGTVGDPTPAVVLYAASKENFNAENCTFGFTSTLYGALVESGQPFYDLDPTTPGESSVSLGEGKAAAFVRDGIVYVTRSGGFGLGASVEIWGDGEFTSGTMPSSSGQFTLQLAVEGFRISPF